MKLLGQWRLATKILPFVLIVIALKILVHELHFEILSLSPLFSGVVGATVFLLGFMIAGTLSDYKESERLPSDLAASLHSVIDECDIAAGTKGKHAARACKQCIDLIASSVLDWLRAKSASDVVLTNIADLNSHFVKLEPHVQATFINRLKTEQNQIRKMVLRMQTIRETSFVGTGYAIAELSTFFLLTGLILTKNLPSPESIFFVGLISFILTYMIALITDLDNPFDYSNESEGGEVSLKPLEQVRKRLSSSK
jgi:hypothetical protein